MNGNSATSFDEQFLRYHADLTARAQELARRYPPVEADDILQEGVVRMRKKFETFNEPQDHGFRRWGFKFLAYIARELVNRERRDKSLTPEVQALLKVEQEVMTIELKEMRQQLGQCLKKLSRQEMLLLKNRALRIPLNEYLEAQEISSANTAHQQWRRLRRKLWECAKRVWEG